MRYNDILENIMMEFQNFEDLSPNFMTSKNGIQIGFTFKVLHLLNDFADKLYQNDTDFNNIEFDKFLKIVKQCIIDFYTENKFSSLQSDNNILVALKKYIEEPLANSNITNNLVYLIAIFEIKKSL